MDSDGGIPDSHWGHFPPVVVLLHKGEKTRMILLPLVPSGSHVLGSFGGKSKSFKSHDEGIHVRCELLQILRVKLFQGRSRV